MPLYPKPEALNPLNPFSLARLYENRPWEPYRWGIPLGPNPEAPLNPKPLDRRTLNPKLVPLADTCNHRCQKLR